MEPTKQLENNDTPKKQKQQIPSHNTTGLASKISGNENLMCLVEAVLYASSRAMHISEIAELVDATKAATRRALDSLAEWYNSRPSAIEILRLPGERYLLQLRAEYSKRFSSIMPGGFLKMSELKTLALIALEQPITQSKLVKIRGSHVYKDLKRLEELGFIRREDSGRTKKIWTTDFFADYFGLDRDLKKMKLQFRARLRKWNVDMQKLREITSSG